MWCRGELSSPAVRTFVTKSTKSPADCDAAAHAKMYAARYLPHHAA